MSDAENNSIKMSTFTLMLTSQIPEDEDKPEGYDGLSIYDAENNSTVKGNTFTLMLTTPIPEGDGKEPGDYEGLRNKPRINGVELVGDLSLVDLGIDIPLEPLSTTELDNIINV